MPVVNDRPGAFELGGINLISYKSFDGDGTPKRLDIRNLVIEFNIYEDLSSPFLSGDMTLLDATNAIQSFPITGFERLELYFRTPGAEKGFDFSVKSGHPMFIYSLENRQGANPRSQMYTLKFISMEAMRDNITRVKQAFTGTIDKMIAEICYNYLKTKKDVLIEDTQDAHKIVMPRLKPTKAITFLRKNARSLHYANSGFLFYETSLGFNFKSYEGLFCKKDGSPRPVKANYSPKVKNVMKSGDKGKEIYDLQSVEDFRVIQQHNSLLNAANGVYASKLILHDLFNKTFEEQDFDYNIEYMNQNHLEQDSDGGKRSDNGILPVFPISETERFGNSPGATHYQSDTKKIHNSYEQPEPRLILQKRISQHLAVNSLILEITVPGSTEINAGDIVKFSMPKYAENMTDDQKDQDVYLTGRYLISAARHQVSSTNKRHTLVLELVKDSFNKAYPEDNIDLFTNNENDAGRLYSASDLDDHI